MLVCLDLQETCVFCKLENTSMVMCCGQRGMWYSIGISYFKTKYGEY